jgi:hypothetical protein
LIRTIFAYSPSILKTNDIRAATFAQLLNAAELNQAWPAEGEQTPKHRQTNIVLFIRCMVNALQLSAQGFETGTGSWTNQAREPIKKPQPLSDLLPVPRSAALRPSKGMECEVTGTTGHALIQVRFSPIE